MKTGTHHTPEALAKMMGNKNAEGCVRSPETIAKMRAAQSAPEARARLRAAATGKHQSDEARAKNRAAHTGKHPSAETRAKMRAGHTGKHPSEETIAKLRAAHTGKHPSAEARAKMREAQSNRSAETCAKMSAAKLGPNHPNWMGGISRDPYGWEFNDELKEEVRRRDGYKCQLCGVPQAECKKALAVHHIDYDKKNSDPVNLVALCVFCNLKVNANRQHWTAHFQAMAIERDIATMRRNKQPGQET